MFCDVQIVKNIEKKLNRAICLSQTVNWVLAGKKNEATHSILILCSSSFDLKY